MKDNINCGSTQHLEV